MKNLYTKLLVVVALLISTTTFAQYHLNLDGTNDYVRVPTYASLQGATGVTVEAWINATAWKTPIYKCREWESRI